MVQEILSHRRRSSRSKISETRKLTRELNGLEMILTFISGNQDKDVDLSREDNAKVLGQ